MSSRSGRVVWMASESARGVWAASGSGRVVSASSRFGRAVLVSLVFQRGGHLLLALFGSVAPGSSRTSGAASTGRCSAGEAPFAATGMFRAGGEGASPIGARVCTGGAPAAPFWAAPFWPAGARGGAGEPRGCTGGARGWTGCVGARGGAAAAGDEPFGLSPTTGSRWVPRLASHRRVKRHARLPRRTQEFSMSEPCTP